MVDWPTLARLGGGGGVHEGCNDERRVFMLFRLAGWLRVVNRKDVSKIGGGLVRPKGGSGDLPAPGGAGKRRGQAGGGGRQWVWGERADSITWWEPSAAATHACSSVTRPLPSRRTLT